MGSMLETIKKGISALNPIGEPVNKKPKAPIDATKNTGYLGDTAKKLQKSTKAIEKVAEETK
jgi:hypothetical protein